MIGLKREIKEEVGMTITVGDAYAAFTYTINIKGSHSIQVMYFAQFIEPHDQITLDPEDHSTYEWFSATDVIDRKAELTSESMIDPIIGEDPQYTAIKRGFELLQGDPINPG